MKDNLRNILSEQPCPNQEVFFDYIEQKMNSKDIHAFEKHLASCPFCEEALEGLQNTSRAKVLESTTSIHQKIDKITTQRTNYWKLLVAACVIFVLTFAGVSQLDKFGEQQENLAVQTEEIESTKSAPLKTNSDAQIVEKSVIEEEESEIIIEGQSENSLTFKKENEKIEEIDEVMIQQEELMAMDSEDDFENSEMESTSGMVIETEKTTSAPAKVYSLKEIEEPNQIDFSNMMAFVETPEEEVKTRSYKKRAKENNKMGDADIAPSQSAAEVQIEVFSVDKIMNSLKSKNYELALIQIQQNTNPDFTFKWLKAFTLFNLGRNSEATLILEELSKVDNEFKNEASKLLKN